MQRIALVYGGESSEHSVSCVTAVGVIAAIDTSKYEVIPVGITKSSCWSPTLESSVGYVVFDQGLSNGETWVGKTLTIEDAAGDEHDCEIVTLPFFDKEKKIPRGLSPELG